MKIRTKVVLAFLLMALFLLFGGSAGLFASTKLSAVTSAVLNDYLPILNSLVALKSRTTALERSTSGRLATSDSNQKNVSNVASFRQNLLSFDKLTQGLFTEINGGAEVLLLGHEIIAATDSLETSVEARKQLKADLSRMQRMLDFAIKSTTQIIHNRKSDADSRLQIVVNWHRATTLLSVLACYAISVWFTSLILRRIENLQHAATVIGQGYLQFPVKDHTQDEIGSLGQTLEQMAESLRQNMVSRSYLSGIISSMPTLLIVADQRGIILSANAAAAEILGWESSELKGRSVFDCLPALDSSLRINEEGKVEIVEKLAGRIISQRVATAEPKVLLLSAKVQPSSEANQLELLIVGQDISQWQQIREERDDYHSQLKRAEHMASLGTMSAMLAHRLNQPLTVLRLYLQQARRALSQIACPEGIAEKLEECLVEVASVTVAVRDVLQYARRPSADMRQRVMPACALRKVVATLEERALRANLAIVIDDLAPECEVLAGAGEIDEICYILVENAIHAANNSNAQSELTIRLQQCCSKLTLEFSDTCGGIPESHIDKIFDLFFTTKAPTEGTGLGLCIVKQIVTNLGGELVVESSEGEGTIFRLSLPIVQEQTRTEVPHFGATV